MLELKNMDYKFNYKELIKDKTPDVRYLDDMKEVVYDKDWLETADKTMELYYMYRKVREINGLKHNITIIPPKMLGKEFVKTKGHEHIGEFAEIYIVLEGEAIYLMQKTENEIINDVFAIKAKKGDIAFIPPYYSHITINPSNNNLVMADWTDKTCISDYEFIKQKQGACYYYLDSGWLKNPNYTNVPELRFKPPLQKMPQNWQETLRIDKN